MNLKKELMAGVAALTMATPVLAQPPVPFSWTGFYAGGNVGYSWGHGAPTYNEPAFGGTIPTTITGSNQLNNAIGGAQVGYNWQTGAWLWGLETDLQIADEKGSQNFSYPYDCEGACAVTGQLNSKIEWFGTARARVGWLVTPATLVYATGGLAYGRVNVGGQFTDTGCTPACMWSFNQSAVNVGWTVGTGFEAVLAPNWTWKVEYLYVDLGSLNGNGYDNDFGGVYTYNAHFTDNILRFGLNWYFH